MKKNSRAEEWLKNAVKDKHVRMIPFSEISKVKYNVAKGGSGTIHLGAWRNMHIAIKEQHNTNDLIKEVMYPSIRCSIPRYFIFIYAMHFDIARPLATRSLSTLPKMFQAYAQNQRILFRINTFVG